MIISICVIGFNKNAPEFIKRFKRLSHYTKGDGNIYASRIHTIHVLNKEDPKYEEVTLTYAKFLVDRNDFTPEDMDLFTLSIG
jgi:hypothetical protein